MGKETRKKISKTIKGVGNLRYVEMRSVPMTVDPELGNLIDAKVIERVERLTAESIIARNIPLRGQEVLFLRSLFALSQRDFAEKLGLSHVAIFKWEKAKNRRLDVVNEIAVKALVAGLLELEITASVETLVGRGDVSKRLILDYSELASKHMKRAAA